MNQQVIWKLMISADQLEEEAKKIKELAQKICPHKFDDGADSFWSETIGKRCRLCNKFEDLTTGQ